MIDPLGPDPADPANSSRRVAEIVSEFETPGSFAPLRPKVRYANYDSPEAQVRKEQSPRIENSPSNEGSPRVQIMARKGAPPRIEEVPLPIPTAEPVASALPPAPKPGPRPSPRPTTTALARPTPPKPTKLERAISVARTVLPIVGKMLPLLEGNVVSAASNLFANRPMHEVNLKPLEESISRLQSEHRALAFHSGEQKRALQRLEDDFTVVQEAVQKNAADQAELIEHVAKLAKRTSSFMRLVTILLVVSILFTALLCVRIAYLIRF
ncbi:MAG TPA: hypothetical protein VK574_06970 [Terracidiphilus sp.]|nr:hypothetical protein [Terracidiphilus sp.]